MESQSKSSHLYRIQHVPGRGIGLVATAEIGRGTRILAEDPMFRVPYNGTDAELLEIVAQRLSELEKEQVHEFFALPNFYKRPEDNHNPLLGIVRSNLTTLDRSQHEGGLFFVGCRINHACLPNSEAIWNMRTQKMTVHAAQTIRAGDEITASYLPILGPHAARQAYLQERFGLTCRCKLCTMDPEQREGLDPQLARLRELEISLSNGTWSRLPPLKVLHGVRARLDVFTGLGLADRSVSKAYEDALWITIHRGDLARAKVFTERAYATRVPLEGEDGHRARTLRALARDPAKHPKYGSWMDWRTSVQEIPRELGDDAFEAWLWKLDDDTDETEWIPDDDDDDDGDAEDALEQSGGTSHANTGIQTTSAPRRLADVRNDLAFPSFTALPHDSQNDFAFYQFAPGYDARPRKHWCFLAEMEEMHVHTRIVLTTRDKVGDVIPVVFYTPGHGLEIGLPGLNPGYTVFPVSLEALMSLNDTIQEYGEVYDGARKCHGCDKISNALKKCGKCSLFWYCGKDCQIKAWRGKGHKADCELLAQHRDLRDLFVLEWDVFEDFYRFPLNLLL